MRKLDNLLINGDMQSDLCGSVKQVKRLEELVQRVMIRLTMRQGDFRLSPELGSRFHKLNLHQSDELSLFSAAAEALEEIPEVEVIRVEKRVDFAEQSLYLTIYLKLGEEQQAIDLKGRVWRENRWDFSRSMKA